VVRWLLNHLASPVLLVGIAGASIGIGVATEAWQSHRRRGRAPRSNEMLTTTVEFVGLAYAILIGFVIVSLWQDQADAREAVADEASALHDIAVLSHAFPDSDDGRLIQRAVEDYAQVVIGQEWELLRTGSESGQANLEADQILHAISEVDTSSELGTALQSSMIDSFKEFSGRRTRRLAMADVRLAGELWLIAVLSSVALVVLVALFEGEGQWHLAATVIVSAMVGMILFAIVALSYPFSGDVSVSSQPFSDVRRLVAVP
jgi:hypothetical protein